MTSSDASKTSFDAIVVGGGHNGLVAAATLAASGRRAIVLEASAEMGGGAATREFFPGFRTSALAHIVNRFSREVISALGLDASHFSGEAMPSLSLDPVNGPVVLRGAYGERIDGVSASEQKAFLDLRGRLFRQAGIFGRLMSAAPARPGDIGLDDMMVLGKAGLSLLRGGRDEAREFGRMALMNVRDVLDDHLSDDRLKGLLAFDAVLGIHLGPRSPTSLMGLYYRLGGEVAGVRGGQFQPKGGMGTLAAMLEEAARKKGVQLRAGAPVSRILTDRDRTTGVVLETGETIHAPLVLTAIHPALALGKLLERGEIDAGLGHQVRHIRSKGNVAKLHLALDRLPHFPGVDETDLAGRLVIARSADHVENAFNPAKYGEFSPDPVMEITLPSLADPSLAPAGSHVLSAVVQFAPYDLKTGWEGGRSQFHRRIMATLENAAPGIGGTVVGSELLVPPDIETRYRMPGGHWHHGGLQVDRMLFNRPTFETSGYATPVAGLYLAGAGSHPGGGISGLPGLLAARAAIAGRTA